MRSLFIFSFIFLLAQQTIAQKNITITYRYTYDPADTVYYDGENPPFYLVIQDPVAICFSQVYRNKTGENEFNIDSSQALGSSYLPGITYYDRKNRRSIQSYYKGKQMHEPCSLTVRKKIKGSFRVFKESKVILGHVCYKAVGDIASRSYTVWFCPELPAGFGPYMLTQLPGTILECRENRTGSITLAVEIVNDGLPVTEPDFCPKIRKSRN